MIENLPIQITGHCLITDDLGHVHLNQLNSIHSKNMELVIARGLAHEENNSVYVIAFGNGGTDYNHATYSIVYQPPRDTGWDTTLYNQTYSEIAHVGTGGDIMSTDKSTSGSGVASLDKDRISQVVISCTLGKYEPVTQIQDDTSPTATNAIGKGYVPGDNNFIFDEIGLFTSGLPLTASGGYQYNPIDGTKEFKRLLTHLTFSPVLKTANRIFNIKYTLTVYVNRTDNEPSITIIQPS